MLQHERVTETLEDGLIQREWEFAPIDSWGSCLQLVLDKYYEKERPTTRHKFQYSGVYSRLNSRDSNISLENVDLPDWVKEEVLNSFISKIKVVKQLDRGV